MKEPQQLGYLDLGGPFYPERVLKLTHRLSGHPLLEVNSLLELARRLEPKGHIRYHGGGTTAATDFSTAPKAHANGLSAVETIQRINEPGSWVAFHNVYLDPEYKPLIDELLDEARSLVEPYEPGMFQRAGWIFLSAPEAVTPFHMDHEHNFLMQVRGKKRVSVWDPADRLVIPETALEAFHATYSLKEVKYRDEFQARAVVSDLTSGMGVYMPSTAPHWVKNGDDVSVTLSVTFCSAETQRKKRVYRANHALRRRGIAPSPYGLRPWMDSIKSQSVRWFGG